MSRTPFVPAELLSKLWRAVIEFDMLQAGDRILIGLSGGKDSMFLTAALAEIQKYAPVPFDLACYTVDAMFSPAFPKAELEAFCGYYGLKHYSEKVDVNSAWQNKGLYGIIVVVGQGHFVKTKLQCRTVGSGTAEISTGEAGRIAFILPGRVDIDLFAVMFQTIVSAESFQLCFGKSR